MQVTDLQVLAQNRTQGATMFGATNTERATVLLGKAAYFGLLLGVPLTLHGPSWELGAGLAACLLSQSVALATTFAVSHNVPESKPLAGGVPEDVLYLQVRPRPPGRLAALAVGGAQLLCCCCC